ncbi:NAD-P-binding protein [Dentipellis sp. KUC8613]|nr:NAD-P-binding protein [Dentipellis sp. KUC8613]
MSSFRTFAVAGIGSLGGPIAEELLKQKAAGQITDVILLTRASSNNTIATHLATLGARLVAVDYTSLASLTAALTGTDVLLSTVSHLQLHVQPLLARAAQAAGVRLFAPSEYGAPTDGPAADVPGVLQTKRALHTTLRELGLPYVLTFTGAFPDYVFVPDLFIDLVNGKATVGGDGTAVNSFTSMPDIARFVVHALVTLPPAELNWKTLRIEGERISFNEIFNQYTAKTGKHITVSYKSLAELEAAFKANPSDLASYLHWVWGQGKGTVGTPEQLSNGLYPEWNPKKAIDAIAS